MSTPRRIKIKGRPSPDNVLVVGSVAYDSIVTPHESGEKILGGSASYACLAASYFAPPHIVGVVGHDFRDRDRKNSPSAGLIYPDCKPTRRVAPSPGAAGTTKITTVATRKIYSSMFLNASIRRSHLSNVPHRTSCSEIFVLNYNSPYSINSMLQNLSSPTPSTSGLKRSANFLHK